MPKHSGIAWSWSKKKRPSNFPAMAVMNADGGNRNTRRKSRVRKRRQTQFNIPK